MSATHNHGFSYLLVNPVVAKVHAGGPPLHAGGRHGGGDIPDVLVVAGVETMNVYMCKRLEVCQ